MHAMSLCCFALTAQCYCLRRVYNKGKKKYWNLEMPQVTSHLIIMFNWYNFKDIALLLFIILSFTRLYNSIETRNRPKWLWNAGVRILSTRASNGESISQILAVSFGSHNQRKDIKKNN